MDFMPFPDVSTQPLDAIIPLLGDRNALVGPSGEDTLLMEYKGVEYLIPADLDAESATLTDGRGMNILADTDGDGRVDYVSAVDYNGTWSAWRWSQTTPEQAIEEQSPAITPEQGGRNWDARAWKCVERGEWG